MTNIFIFMAYARVLPPVRIASWCALIIVADTLLNKLGC